ncbi:MAG: hypothetical protein LBV42_02555, partial [Methanobrevibacter sp.]|nr:hypothetical protein [Methanobrevibacter sp.]
DGNSVDKDSYGVPYGVNSIFLSLYTELHLGSNNTWGKLREPYLDKLAGEISGSFEWFEE